MESLVVSLGVAECGGDIRRWGLVKGSDLIGAGLTLNGLLDHSPFLLSSFLCLMFPRHGGLVHHRPKGNGAKQPWAETMNQNNFGFRYFISTAGN